MDLPVCTLLLYDNIMFVYNQVSQIVYGKWNKIGILLKIFFSTHCVLGANVEGTALIEYCQTPLKLRSGNLYLHT